MSVTCSVGFECANRYLLKMPVKLLVFVSALSLLGCRASAMGAALIVEPLRIPIVGSPSIPHRKFQIVTHDNLKLEGWSFVPAASVANKGTVILVHGKDINRQHFLSQIPWLLKEGYSVFAYDQRAHGRSEGHYTTFGKNEVRDLQKVMDLSGAPHVMLIGESLGAAVVLQTAAVDSRVSAVVAGASFADLRSLISQKKPFFMSEATRDEAIELAQQKANFQFDEVGPERCAPNIKVPVLLLHGMQDTYIPMEHAVRLREALVSPKKLVRLDGVGHADILLHDEVWKLIVEFLRHPELIESATSSAPGLGPNDPRP
jgi:uncharacterized protein